jgi:hypothetical protein
VSDLHGKKHVPENTAPWHQIALLKRNAEIGLRLGHVIAVDLDDAARGAHEARGYSQERGLSAAARSKHGNKRTRVQLKRDRIDCREWRLTRSRKFLMDIGKATVGPGNLLGSLGGFAASLLHCSGLALRA